MKEILDELTKQATQGLQQAKEELNQAQAQTNWLNEEHKRLEESRPQFDQKPYLEFEENKPVSFRVDFSTPFDKYVDPVDQTKIKKIIPVNHDGVDKNLWLNVKNPLYADIVKLGVQGQNTFKVMQTGQGENTRYHLVKD